MTKGAGPVPILKIPKEAQGLLKIPMEKFTHPLIERVCKEIVLEGAARSGMTPTTKYRCHLYASFGAIKKHQAWWAKHGGPD